MGNTKHLSDRLIKYINCLLDTTPSYSQLEKDHEYCIKKVIERAYLEGKSEEKRLNKNRNKENS